jgi:protocatechuate 3,4-dioxygenase beta subunit
VLLVTAATAQDHSGRIEGVVQDAASHQPVRKATVFINFMGGFKSMVTAQTQNAQPQTAITDTSGKFTFNSLSAGQYQLTVTHPSYPQGRMGVRKSLEVKDGTASGVTVELVPGASITGRILDEDGDPLNGCFVQVHPAGNFNMGGPMSGPMMREDGSYKLYEIPPGKYTISAQCVEPVFQPRPLSAGPDPPPSAAYPTQFYPAASDLKSAEILELLPGEKKSGVDFRMRPLPVTHIHGTLDPGSADWRGRNALQVELVPLDPQGTGAFRFRPTSRIDFNNGTFEINQVFPGSYHLVALSQNFGRQVAFGNLFVGAGAAEPEASDRIGAVVRVDVTDKPIELSLALHRAIDVSGTIEIEHGTDTNNQVTPTQLSLQLTSDYFFAGPPPTAQVKEDGGFTIKSVLLGEWRIVLLGPFAFLKSVWLGSEDFTNRPLDLTSGSAAPLKIVASTNTATVRGTAPAGKIVFFAREDEQFRGPSWLGAPVDANGQFTLSGFAPGKYRINLGENGDPIPSEGGQEVTVREGETVTIEVKPERRP